MPRRGLRETVARLRADHVVAGRPIPPSSEEAERRRFPSKFVAMVAIGVGWIVGVFGLMVWFGASLSKTSGGSDGLAMLAFGAVVFTAGLVAYRRRR